MYTFDERPLCVQCYVAYYRGWHDQKLDSKPVTAVAEEKQKRINMEDERRHRETLNYLLEEEQKGCEQKPCKLGCPVCVNPECQKPDSPQETLLVNTDPKMTELAHELCNTPNAEELEWRKALLDFQQWLDSSYTAKDFAKKIEDLRSRFL